MASTVERPALDNTSTSASGADKSTPMSHFYRVIWRWHFYAGLFVIPIVVILSITGIIYLFKPQIESAMYRDLMVVSPSGPVLSYSQQLESAAATYPDGSLTRFRPSDAANRAAEVGVKTADGRNLTVFVDPYTGAVKGDRNDDTTLAAQAELIHGTLLIGNAGDRHRRTGSLLGFGAGDHRALPLVPPQAIRDLGHTPATPPGEGTNPLARSSRRHRLLRLAPYLVHDSHRLALDRFLGRPVYTDLEQLP